jgi:radical SAM superfamily enzyme YgiQ (UPF0313 family)
VKLLLVSPIAKNKFLGRNFAFALPFLSMPVIAAYTPLDVDITFIDERVDKIDFDGIYDIVGITAMTPLAPRAYEIADHFRKKGSKVVIGGMHASARPEEVLEHADAVVIGEGETLWPKVLDDYKAGQLKKVYKNEDYTDLNNLLPPRRDLLNKNKYAPVEFVETTRGCPFGCHFCSVTKFFGGRYRTRPVDHAVEEISKFKTTTRKFSIKNAVFFVDDNIIGNREHAKELFQKIKPYKLNWLGQASINIAKDDELLQLAKESGCIGFMIGFESLSDEVLKNVAKKANKTIEYLESIKKIQSYSLGVMGSFIFGFDQDDVSVFDKYWSFIKKAKLEAVYLGILTPYPGTRFFDELDKQERIFDYDWSNYDTSHVVFRPKKMSIKELKDGYLWAWKKTYALPFIFYRLRHTKAMRTFVWPMNIGFHYSINKLVKELNI